MKSLIAILILSSCCLMTKAKGSGWLFPPVGVIRNEDEDDSFLRDVKTKFNTYNRTIPKEYDLRTHPHCAKAIKNVRHQGTCGSCWAVSSASMLSDRYCLQHPDHPDVELSAEDLTFCCTYCTFGKPKDYPGINSCLTGGDLRAAMRFFLYEGIVTGGGVNSNKGCKPYSESTYRYNISRPCELYCTNKKFDPTRSYTEDRIFAKETFHINKYKPEEVQMEVLVNGPVVVVMDVTLRLQSHYKSGVYKEARQKGDVSYPHAIKIVGWGEEGGTDYWLIANSWGKTWGEEGFFKVPRGINYEGIEKQVSSAIPQLTYKVYKEGSDNKEQTAKPSDGTREGPSIYAIFSVFVLCTIKFIKCY